MNCLQAAFIACATTVALAGCAKEPEACPAATESTSQAACENDAFTEPRTEPTPAPKEW